MGHEPLSPFLSFPQRMSRFLNLPQPSEVPESLADQFFGPKLASTEDRISAKGESGSRSSPTLPLDDSPKNDQNWTATNPQQPNSFISPSSFSSNSQVLAKGSGPLGPWIGISQFILGLFLLSIDAIFNPISQSCFAVSASIFAILCAVLSFVSASRWPDRISIWLLIPCCLISSILWAFLCAECAHKLVTNSGMDCPKPMPKFGIGWLEEDGQEGLRPCLGPILHSLFICAALIGVFLSLCSLLLCANSLRPNQTNKRTPSSQPIVASARRPFSLLILPAGIRRPKPVHLPLIKMNGQMHRENITMENGKNRGN